MHRAVTDQIARKSLRLSPRSKVEHTDGKRTSALGSDCGYIEWSFNGLVAVVHTSSDQLRSVGSGGECQNFRFLWGSAHAALIFNRDWACCYSLLP
jgi:hypothetical protein